MLQLHPDLVEMQHAAQFRAAVRASSNKKGGMLTPEGAVGFGWQAQDLCAEGASGNAAAADAKRGEILVDRAAQALLKLCDEIADFPMETLRTAPARWSAGP